MLTCLQENGFAAFGLSSSSPPFGLQRTCLLLSRLVLPSAAKWCRNYSSVDASPPERPSRERAAAAHSSARLNGTSSLFIASGPPAERELVHF